VSLGPDCKSLEKGNTVLYNKFGIGCTDLEMGDDSYIVIKEQDLIGTFPGSGATASDIPKMSPLGDRILIKPEEVSNTSAGGIMLTDGAVERPSTATVIAAGPGKKGEDGELVEMKIKKGDKVMFFKYAGDKMYDSDGLEYIVVRELDILATM
jgi:chaperonin GroES|tara:strand:+ start:46085 stop:46543 length:459 start_codon:yes stop_codon:yes gene_type:complete